jgi:diphthine methyl ester synthase
MTLTLIGCGLYDAYDLSVRAVSILKQADIIYLEQYTAIFDSSALQTLIGKPLTTATRTFIEDATELLHQSKEKKVCVLIVGDVFSATTHSDLYLRAKQQNIDVTVLFNASILTAVGQTGLSLYTFGKTTSMVFFEPSWKPATPYDVLAQNISSGLHTMVLLDIKVAESSKTDLLHGVNNPQQPRFMTINQAITQLFELESLHKKNIFTPDTLCVGVARLGSPTAKIVCGTATQLLTVDFGEPMHTLLIPGRLHFHEQEVLDLYKLHK